MERRLRSPSWLLSLSPHLNSTALGTRRRSCCSTKRQASLTHYIILWRRIRQNKASRLRLEITAKSIYSILFILILLWILARLATRQRLFRWMTWTPTSPPQPSSASFVKVEMRKKQLEEEHGGSVCPEKTEANTDTWRWGEPLPRLSTKIIIQKTEGGEK